MICLLRREGRDSKNEEVLVHSGDTTSQGDVQMQGLALPQGWMADLKRVQVLQLMKLWNRQTLAEMVPSLPHCRNYSRQLQGLVRAPDWPT